MMKQNLEKFNNSDFDRGASKGKELFWLLLRGFFFEFSVLPLSGLRRKILNLFGSKIQGSVTLKPQVKITFPWKLSVGENSWIGEEAWLMNLAPIEIGANVSISQRVMLCTGSHNWKKESFDLITQPIIIKDGAWICANVFIGPGVTIGENCVVTAGSVVTCDLPANMICSGNPAKPVKER
ncbi:WcaF family extracellular polysaccharide biosynthesis acetyltransferase [Lentisphaera profundi]|uniref:WcaF family extracellular polysaccharide biosynthesis acetyltransferase n=1 Tax=Lentisphaera profundi TaxID=1658616 RepID=A0ABY7VVF3_9BACT|nr:WcaF family extracellular polysaccharide biosynthesis acetyltransferase [Lentisphaera profundi]WDE98211.1 WcaF family extracellular polysaccharide biosynthesis acetyltransferase [Lentisphaera profundi]